MATAERKNHDEWKKRNLAEKAELERKVKLAEPEIAKALDAVSSTYPLGSTIFEIDGVCGKIMRGCIIVSHRKIMNEMIPKADKDGII